MSDLDISVSLLENNNWLFSWTDGVGPYQIWFNGFMLAQQATTTYTWFGPGYTLTPPPLEIADMGSSNFVAAQNYLYPPYVIIQWRGVQGATAYIIQQLIDSVWEDIGWRKENGTGYYQWQSTTLIDQTLYNYRVYAVDIAGNPGAILPFSILEVCNPQPPSVAFEINSSLNLVVSQA